MASSSVRRGSRWWLAIVAVLALGLGLWWGWPEPPPPEVGALASPVRGPRTSEPEGALGAIEAPVPSPERPVVECQLSEAPGLVEHLIIDEVDPETLAFQARHAASIAGAWFRFRPHNVDGLGWIVSAEHERVAIAWVDGACTDLVELTRLPVRTVSGVVTGQIEVGGVAVHGSCEGTERRGFSGSLDPDGAFRLAVPPGHPCSLEVRRVFGGRTLTSGPFAVASGAHDVEELELPGPLPSGVGLGLVPSPRGLLVHDLELGGAAARAGVRKRDLIVSLDGEAAAELDADSASDLEGPLELEVERDGAVVRIEVPREPDEPG